MKKTILMLLMLTGCAVQAKVETMPKLVYSVQVLETKIVICDENPAACAALNK